MDLSLESISEIVSHMRAMGTDTEHCEVKAAASGVPKTLIESVCAFANGSGGLVLLGLSEKDRFAPVPGFEPKSARDALISIAAKLTPVCRLHAEILMLEGAPIVAAWVPAIDPSARPCYITERGRYSGAFIRTGDGDRRLTHYEINRMLENLRQPKYDLEPVPEASLSDLNTAVIAKVIERQKLLSPRIFGTFSDADIQLRLGILAKHDGKLVPTLGGLLACGIYPQQFFPRLSVLFTIYPGNSKAGGAVRYLETRNIAGSIPEMLRETLERVASNMRTGAIVDTGFRQDVPDYPIRALREAVANALQHRDYSPEARSSAVQVNMFSDHIEVLSPGGLFGGASIDDIAPGISATRNVNLSNILESTPFEGAGQGFVVENRGTGLFLIRKELSDALMPAARITNALSYFAISFGKRTLSEAERNPKRHLSTREAILAALRTNESLSVKELIEMSQLSRGAISSHLRSLVAEGLAEPTEIAKSPRQRYRLVRRSGTDN